MNYEPKQTAPPGRRSLGHALELAQSQVTKMRPQLDGTQWPQATQHSALDQLLTGLSSGTSSKHLSEHGRDRHHLLLTPYQLQVEENTSRERRHATSP